MCDIAAFCSVRMIAVLLGRVMDEMTRRQEVEMSGNIYLLAESSSTGTVKQLSP